MSDNKNVIGKFTGECADAEVTNENGLDITREVWETVFQSDLYKQGIDLGWYIGFLGHPDDPGDMNFKNACIVMTEGHIDDDGKVYGQFNLIDTPVGRIVKTFIDAGVTFGISVRGAGDIYNNSVDPETFVFRGFDLVTFPAYKEAIPEFQAIAASTDSNKRQKYQSVCNAVNKDLKNITSCEAIDVLLEQFPEQSDTAKDLENRKEEIQSESEDTQTVKDEVKDKKISALTDLYLAEVQKNSELSSHLSKIENEAREISIAASKKLNVMMRITAAQEHDVKQMEDDFDENERKLQRVSASLNTLRASNRKLVKRIDSRDAQIEDLKAEIKAAKQDKAKSKIEASKQISSQIDEKDSEIKSLKQKVSDLKSENLQYSTEADTIVADRDEQANRADKLQRKLDETVASANEASKRASNLETQVRDLKAQVKAATALVEEYQDAYASLYSNAIGVGLGDISVNASTSVKQLQDKIAGTSSIDVVDEFMDEPEVLDTGTEFDDDSLVTV